MKKIFSPELVGAIAESLKNTAAQPEVVDGHGAQQKAGSKPMAFLGQLLSNSVLSGFVSGGRPETAVLRGSLVGLASGVDAVVKEKKAAGPGEKPQTGSLALTVGTYVVGGILAALIFKGMRGGQAEGSMAVRQG